MSRVLHWHLDERDLFELFEATFGEHRDTCLMGAEFDEDLGVLNVYFLDEAVEDRDDGHYAGVRIP